MKKHNKVNHIHFQSIDSTNTWAKNNASTLDPSQITCITAGEQTAGRGRFEKKWASPKGVNLYASFFFCVERKDPFIANLAQLLSISCCKLLTHLGFSPTIKWPNDILIEGKKVGGILCETLILQKSLGIVLGIGLNVNMDQNDLDRIDQQATSLKQASEQEWSVDKVLEHLTSFFLEDLNTLADEGFQSLLPYYDSHLAYKGQTVTFEDGNQVLKGVCHRLSDTGTLILLSPSGEEIEVRAGCMVKAKT